MLCVCFVVPRHDEGLKSVSIDLCGATRCRIDVNNNFIDNESRHKRRLLSKDQYAKVISL